MLGSNVYREIKSWKKPVHIARSKLAKSYLKLLPGIEVVGITGSVGKTLTQNAIASVLSQKFNTKVGNENLDPTFRIPKTILAAKPWHKKLVLEYGVEHPGDMDFYLSIARPQIAVVTTIAPTHTKYFGNIDGVLNEKSKLVEALPKSGFAVLNADDEKVVRMANRTQAQIRWFGESALAVSRGSASGQAKDGVKISHYAQDINGATFRLHYNGEKATVHTRVIGKHHLTSMYAAATVGAIEGLTLKQIAKGLSLIKPPSHRLNVIATKSVTILDDTYNSSPKAAGESFKTFLELAKNKTKVAVFGEMKDLGSFSVQAHEDLGKLIAKSSTNVLVTIGSVAEIIATSAKNNGFGGKIINVPNTKQALNSLKKIINSKTVVLVKGSRHAHLEQIVQGLLGKSTLVHCYHCGVIE